NGTDAAYKVLSKFGNKQHPLKTKQLFDAVRKGGVQINSEEGFHKSLARSGRFKKVGRGLWGLTEWYPAAAKKTVASQRGDLTNVSELGGANANGDESSQEPHGVEQEDT